MAAIPRDARVFVAGHAGLVGSAVVDRLRADGFSTILTATRAELDLRDQAAVHRWFHADQPEYVFLVAGTVGGIMANSRGRPSSSTTTCSSTARWSRPASRWRSTKLLYLGSSCIYPRQARQPITEDQLLTGPLEPTNEAYALAKITGIKLCEAYNAQYGCNFISAMPTNLYGPGDNFDPVGGHLVPMLMRRFHEARTAAEPKVEVWGTGSPRRELLHVADLADACLFLMDHYDGPGHINVGTGEDIAIRDLAEMLRDIVHPGAELVFDTTKPDGMPRKVLDVSRLHGLGWRHRIELQEGSRRPTGGSWSRTRHGCGGSRSSLLEPMGTGRRAHQRRSGCPATSAGA